MGHDIPQLEILLNELEDMVSLRTEMPESVEEVSGIFCSKSNFSVV